MMNCSRAHWQEPCYIRYGYICDVLKDMPPEGKELQFKAMLNYANVIVFCLIHYYYHVLIPDTMALSREIVFTCKVDLPGHR